MIFERLKSWLKIDSCNKYGFVEPSKWNSDQQGERVDSLSERRRHFSGATLI